MTCGLCDLFDPSNHPNHSEVPRCGEKDYEALRQRQRRTRAKWEGRIKLVYGGCWRKTAFPNPESARKAARRTGKPTIHSFHCRHCGKFHIGKGEKVGA